MRKVIVWFRQDLRLEDNPALYNAAKIGQVIPVYILDDNAAKHMPKTSAADWWLHHSLESLSADFLKYKIKFILKRGDVLEQISAFIKETKADALYWNRLYDQYFINRDKIIKDELSKKIEVKSFNASLLLEPWEVKTKQGSNFKVFTPFWKYCQSIIPDYKILPIPELQAYKISYDSLRLQDYNLLPTKPDWSISIKENWQVGEKQALKKLEKFLNENIKNYTAGRDVPSLQATSLLSPHLHFGEIGPRQIWQAIKFLKEIDHKNIAHADKYLTEIGWREFCYNLIYHYPTLYKDNFNKKFDKFPWLNNKKLLKLWQKGETGYPIIDAGMRQLWVTGYMHNRVRMIVASFLTKHLFIDWRYGAEWFFDTLVDADNANNICGWQWVAGCGADGAPYFRIFNPILQGQRFDNKGEYVRKWLPNLSKLPDKYIHCPWQADEQTLARAGIKLGVDYPNPIIDHDFARNRALSAYDEI